MPDMIDPLRNTTRLAALILAGTLVAACGSSDDDDDNGNGAPSPTEPDTLGIEATSQQRAVDIFVPDADKDSNATILWSQDPDCEWGANFRSVCSKDGTRDDTGSVRIDEAEADESFRVDEEDAGVTVTIPAGDEALAPDQPYFFAVENGGQASETVAARPFVYHFTGIVRATTLAEDEVLVAGGDFTALRLRTGGLFGSFTDAHDTEQGTPSNQIPRVTGRDATVYAIEPDGEGGWYIGGSFAEIGGVARNNAAHLDRNGTVTDWSPVVDGVVYEITLDDNDDRVFLGGDFDQVNHEERDLIAAIDRTEGSLLDWQVAGLGGNGQDDHVRAITLHKESVYVGGTFQDLIDDDDDDAVERDSLAAFHRESGRLRGWNPRLDGDDPKVYGLATWNDTLIVVGSFERNDQKNLAAYQTREDGPGLAGLEFPQPDGLVYDLLVTDDDTLVIGGAFENYGDDERSRVAASALTDDDNGGLEAETLEWKPPTIEDSVFSIDLSGDGSTLFLGGDFTTVDGERRDRAAAICFSANDSCNDETLRDWDPGADRPVHAVAHSLDREEVMIGGSFRLAGGVDRQHLAAFDGGTGTLMDWDPAPDRPVLSLDRQGSKLFVGGVFETFENADGEGETADRSGIARFDQENNGESSFTIHEDFDLGLDYAEITALATTTDAVYFGGSFTSNGNGDTQYLGRFDSGGGEPDTTDATGGKIYALTVPNDIASEIIAGGNFPDYLAGFDDGLDQTDDFDDTKPDDMVNTLLWVDDKLLLGGYFRNLGEHKREGFGAITVDDDGKADVSEEWQTTFGVGDVKALAYGVDDDIYVAGRFQNVTDPEGTTRSRHNLAAFNADDGSLLGWSPTISDQVDTLTVGAANSERVLYFGGSFESVEDELQPSLGAIRANAGQPQPRIELVW